MTLYDLNWPSSIISHSSLMTMQFDDSAVLKESSRGHGP